MGHMLNQTEMDILTRWHRMKGDPTLWLPGTDHAGIATQMMVERQVTAEGTSRQALGREKFLERVWCWRKQYGGAILEQMKRLGASVDWQREYFTMDANLSVAVREAFTASTSRASSIAARTSSTGAPAARPPSATSKSSTKKSSARSGRSATPSSAAEDEFLTIATTRPETMLGDVAVAIHPEDERYLHLHGKKAAAAADESRDPHRPRRLGQPRLRHRRGQSHPRARPQRLRPRPAPQSALHQRHGRHRAHQREWRPYAGLSRFRSPQAHPRRSRSAGPARHVHDHKLSVGRCDRSKDIIEPRLSTQWFVAVNKSPQSAPGATRWRSHRRRHGPMRRQGPSSSPPSMYEKTYLNWMDQHPRLVHQPPALVGPSHPRLALRRLPQDHRPKPGATERGPRRLRPLRQQPITQETDVLDTWFSSGLLPVSVFGWPFLNSQKTRVPHPSLDLGTGDG
jgi:valyl-tRNA synthetase